VPRVLQQTTDNAGPGLAAALHAAMVALLVNMGAVAGDDNNSNRIDEREALVREIRLRVSETRSYLGKPELDERVLAAVAAVPRHEFVPANQQRFAYDNRPLPIGYDQTISQPSLVAMMTDLLELPEDDCHVLEIGTGSGYQAAILAELCASVHTIEIVEPLASRSAALLQRLGYDNVSVRSGDGFAGWPEAAPFDSIVVTAAAEEAPPPLIEQLRPGGRLVIPLGPAGGVQELVVIDKDADGNLDRRLVFPVRFVPFTRDPE
jgi:protein-L-isoaspartate(D-aspartate) O-methyltransferase